MEFVRWTLFTLLVGRVVWILIAWVVKRRKR